MTARGWTRRALAAALTWTIGGCAPETGPQVEICDNSWDDDRDTLIDCADDDCVGQCPELCADGLDNDGNGAVDCADPVCDGACPEDCADGRDNDGDFLLDCADGDCLGACPEDCANFVDDDGDMLPDCIDPDCNVPTCAEACGDGRDNDADGLADCADLDCDGDCPEACEDARDNDGDGATDCEDPECDGACPEACTDGRDNDGDGELDCDDGDCDGLCDVDGDGYDDLVGGGTDCDDADPDVHPGAPEGCGGADEDCDGLVDDADTLTGADAIPIYTDGDLDGYGRVEVRLGCVAGAGESAISGDCSDGDPTRSPGAPEVCDNIDDDCDGAVDDTDPSLDPASATAWYLDTDGDDHGDPASVVLACEAPLGYVADGTDCHVFDPDVWTERAWWLDGDEDGFGAGVSVLACVQPVGRVDNGDDCNDGDASIHPETVWYLDADIDGYGDPDVAKESCTPPVAYVRNASDCDDTDRDVNPSAGEPRCDGVDDDCDGLVDGADPESPPVATYYRDQDGDGLGDAADTVVDCSAPLGYADAAGDNCPSVANVDQLDDDEDGYGAACECDDADPDSHPGGIGAWPSLLGAILADGDTTDASGQLANGTISGDVTYTVGRHGEAFQFDGDADYVNVTFTRAEPFTLAFWVRADMLDQSDNTGVLATSASTFDTSFQISTLATNEYQVHSDVLDGDYLIGPMSVGWVHVTVAYDGTSLHTWHDGFPTESRLWGDVTPPEFKRLRIGSNRLGSKWFAGAVDHLLLFDRALTDAEVLALADGDAVCLPL